MITVREATLDDVEGIRDVFRSEYGDHYAYPQYCDLTVLARLVYADGTILLVAIDSDTKRVAGTASVVFSVGAYNDLVGEFGRLVVHPDFRGRGIGTQLMEARIERVRSRLHVGIVENRAAHNLSQRISIKFGFASIGFIPMKLLVERRESVAPFVRYFSDALTLRRNNPRIIPEASSIAAAALENCGLASDGIVDDTSAPYPYDDEFELDNLQTEGYASLLRIERGRLGHRDIFGPVRLHYGLFQLRARHSNYWIARRGQQIAGGIGFMIDKVEKTVRVFELISLGEEPIRYLLQALMQQCEADPNIEYVEIDVSAYAPRMQRTLLEIGFLPVSYIPANVFHEVERLDAIKMVKLLVPMDLGELKLCPPVQPFADTVIRSFSKREVLPRLAAESRNTPLFSSLNDEQRERLLGISTPACFVPGGLIYQSGERDGTMHLILSGEVILRDADQQHVASLTDGQCLGETCLLFGLDEAPAHAMDAIAKSQVDTAAFAHSDFIELIRQRPDIGVVLYRNLAADISSKLKKSQPPGKPQNE
jgi:GNAT superfamily N-acetyltransferase